MDRPERIRAERAASPTTPLTDAALAEIERLRRCINMAMGCLDMFASKDQALAWYRLKDALDGREPRDKMEEE